MVIVGMVPLKVTGKRTPPVRSQILPSPILLKEVTVMKNPYSLDDFLVMECSLSEGLQPSEDIHTSWSGGIRMLPFISASRNTIILKRRGS